MFLYKQREHLRIIFMGLTNIGIDLAEYCAKYSKACNKSSILHTKPAGLNKINASELKLAPNLTEDTVQLSKQARKAKTGLLTKDEFLNIKPSEFKELLLKRADINPAIREYIQSPQKLKLYDEVVQLKEIKNLSPEKKEEFLNRLFSAYNNKTSEASAQLEVIPGLIKKGHDPELLAALPIREYNKNQVEYVLNRKDLSEKMLNKQIESLTLRYKESNLSDKALQMMIDNYKQDYHDKYLQDIVRYVDDSNVKYLDDCIELTGLPGNLPYWHKDTAKIIKKYGNSRDMLDRLHRRGHTFDSVQKIFGGEKITESTERLLEFKNYEKFKNIGLEEFKALPTAEKKEFLNSFISSITPKEAKWRNQHALDKDFEYLQSKLKMYKELDPADNESFIKSYQNTIRKMLDEIPDAERKIINSKMDTKSYMRGYREANPIPSLVDEISETLPYKITDINGRKIKVAQMERDPKFGIATHRIPDAESILTIEALEVTDPNMLLCIGTKGGSRGLNFSDSTPALAIKPRRGNDWHVQAYSDIDSGNGASKNIYNFENIMLRAMGNHCDCIDLVPSTIKKKMNLSQSEYTRRMLKLKDCTTLNQIHKIDPQMESAIRKVIQENSLYEGLIRPDVMGVCVSAKTPLNEISPDILNYCERRGIPLIQVTS